MDTMLRSTGRLRKRFLPAVYLDPSFFDGWVEGARAMTDGRDDEAGYSAIVRRVRAGGAVHVVASALTVLRWLQEVATRYRADDEAGREPATREESEFAGMRLQSWLNRHLGDALQGLLQVDVQAFTLHVEQVWEEVPALAILDTDARCTLHALVARHLGCTALATIRPEMVRICEVLQASGGPQALLGPAAVLAALG